ncbi:hypothetical protein KW785_02370 [Candidatus Parcubacteria bacterium]|nr:hypothetical protein [Candidatus Parcubacteria bacterium]
MSDSEKEGESWSSQFLGKLFKSLVILPIIMWIWPNVVPFKFFQFWKARGSLVEWCMAAWPVLVWAVVVNIMFCLFVRKEDPDPVETVVKGFFVSLWAGLSEELTFRWLFFFLGIVGAKITNFFFFGFLGLGIPAWFQNHVMGPIVNFVTFGHLEHYIFNPAGWAVGASMIATNAFFRDGHDYQGIFGWLNSWCVGMFLFWIMFTYGLPAAIVIHFLYNFLIDLTSASMALVTRRRTYAW